MSGQWTKWLPLAAGLAFTGAAGGAEACCTPPPPCCQPPPPPPPPQPHDCGCSGGHTVVVPGETVNVQSTAIAVSGASASANTSAGAGGSVFFGGGGSYSVDQGSPSLIPSLLVDAGAEMHAEKRMVAYKAKRSVTRKVIIQAFCIDDRLVPHPASQVHAERDIDDAYEGEIYRCIAGTRLQALIGEYRGEIKFEGAETLDCQKGDALYHARGGHLACHMQRPERDCNERSLLRRYGAGVKIMVMVREEIYTAYREEVVTTSSSSRTSSTSSAIVLDGGVGGIVR
jgi:hypothetical protein